MALKMKKCLFDHVEFESSGQNHKFCCVECRKRYEAGERMGLNGVVSQAITDTDYENAEEHKPKPQNIESPIIPAALLRKKGTTLIQQAQSINNPETLRFMIINVSGEIDVAIDVIKDLERENKSLKKELEDIETPEPKSALNGIMEQFGTPGFGENVAQVLGAVKLLLSGNGAVQAAGAPAQLAGEGADGNIAYINQELLSHSPEFRVKMAFLVRHAAANEANINELYELIGSPTA